MGDSGAIQSKYVFDFGCISNGEKIFAPTRYIRPEGGQHLYNERAAYRIILGMRRPSLLKELLKEACPTLPYVSDK